MSDTPRTDALEFPVFHRPSFIMHARKLERELSAATAELAATKAKLDFLKSKGLTVGMMKTSDKPEPYLVYVIEPESELCNLELVHKLIDADIERDRTKEQLRVALSGIASAISQMDRHNDWNAYQILLTLTQPNLSADSPEGGNPAKGEGGVPSTFPA